MARMTTERNGEPERLPHDQALLWLNDRLGRPARAALQLGEASALKTVDAVPLMAQGELRHWREANPAGLAADAGDEDVSGLYGIGDAAFLDVTSLAGAIAHIRGEVETLHFPLDTKVSLGVFVWPADHGFRAEQTGGEE
jgi:hypothetical protein